MPRRRGFAEISARRQKLPHVNNTKKAKVPEVRSTSAGKKIPRRKLEDISNTEVGKKPAKKPTSSIETEQNVSDKHFFFPITKKLQESASSLENELIAYFQIDKEATDVATLSVQVTCSSAQEAAELTRRSNDKELTDHLLKRFDAGETNKIIAFFASYSLAREKEITWLREEVCLPKFAIPLLDKLRKTRLSFHRINASDLQKIQSFVALFRGIEILWMETWRTVAIDINVLNNRLLSLMQAITETATLEKPLPRVTVTISKTDDNWTFQVDEKEIVATGNAAKTLATMAIIGDREFHLLEFDRIFRGYFGAEHPPPPAQPGHAFDNKKVDLSELKFMVPKNKRNYRKLMNADFRHDGLKLDDFRNFLLPSKK